MAKIDEPWKCDICGKPKYLSPTNGWWLGFEIESEGESVGVLILRWGKNPTQDVVVSADIEQFQPQMADGHLCGKQCAAQWLSQKALG